MNFIQERIGRPIVVWVGVSPSSSSQHKVVCSIWLLFFFSNFIYCNSLNYDTSQHTIGILFNNNNNNIKTSNNQMKEE